MQAIFLVLAIVIVCSALGVLIFKNPIYSALALIVNLLAVAGIFASLQAHFLAVAQLIVYAGAIMVLVMFVLMLLNSKAETPRWTSFVYLGAGGLAGLLFLWKFAGLLVSGERIFPERLGPAVNGSVAAIGKLLYGEYVFPFEVASILILAAIVGALMLAKKRTPEALGRIESPGGR